MEEKPSVFLSMHLFKYVVFHDGPHLNVNMEAGKQDEQLASSKTHR